MPLTRRGFLKRAAVGSLAAAAVASLPPAVVARPPRFPPAPLGQLPRLAPVASAVDSAERQLFDALRLTPLATARIAPAPAVPETDVPSALLTPPDRARLGDGLRPLRVGDRVIVGDAATRWVLRGDLSRQGWEPVVGVIIARTPIDRFDFDGPADLVSDQRLTVRFQGLVVQEFLPAELTLVLGG